MSTKPFDPTKPVQTRNGRKARVIATDAVSTYHEPIVALVADENGNEFVVRYKANGKWLFDDECRHDLINIPTKREGWVNVYGRHVGNTGIVFWSRAEADAQNTGYRTACARIEWEE